ncbi:superoxide dismutase [Campylobacter corcagiensis]|uniref:Superoxide dismutase n=1 Tax=Campylobacter corcagiensis TaxID=1448857 RepID=A0A7M1LH63_9BACT|nr:superoxide dismutase [Campylobacter corcagiensis]QKF65485.1 superoxide dismutase (Fe) [Campylobacter corcagiensis]QOQ87939.1 superoxide dismutase [Campylobacter corcagiensis]
MLKLRELPFDPKSNAVVSEETCEYHHGKHHKTYVDNFNKQVETSEFKDACFYEILKNAKGGLYNNAAQVYNHDFYWDCIAKKSDICSELKKELESSFKNFKDEFISSATGNFGSGWTWLAYDPNSKKLEIINTSNAHTPVTDGKIPLLVVDVWEHAYYIDARNARASYLEKFYDNINWEFVSKAYEWALKEGVDSIKFYIKDVHPELAGSSCGCSK